MLNPSCVLDQALEDSPVGDQGRVSQRRGAGDLRDSASARRPPRRSRRRGGARARAWRVAGKAVLSGGLAFRAEKCRSGSSQSLFPHPVRLGGPPLSPTWTLQAGRPGRLSLLPGAHLPPGRRSLPNRPLGRGPQGATPEEAGTRLLSWGKPLHFVFGRRRGRPRHTSCAHTCSLSALCLGGPPGPPPRPGPALSHIGDSPAPRPWPGGLLHRAARLPPAEPSGFRRTATAAEAIAGRGLAYRTRHVRLILDFGGHCPLLEEAILASQAFQHHCPGTRWRQVLPQALCDFLSDV